MRVKKTHVLYFDMNAMCVLEERFGDALAAFNKMIGGQGEDEKAQHLFVTLRALLLLGLLMKMKR
ncbi:hypothetical protein P7H21_19690 [Paenibacillus larvae]|nr:hypothetical protein [Paenibacillus larvae]MDT2305715.1 hypothetical protein [Paenibacillus larvae]